MKSHEDLACIDRNISAVFNWANTWQLPIAINKCSIVDYGRSKLVPNDINSDPSLDLASLPRLNQVTDLGVLFSASLSFSDHIHAITTKAKQRSNLIFRCFLTKNVSVLVKGFNNYVRPILEYASQVWSPCRLSDIELLESVQRNFTKRLFGMKNLSYMERLSALGLRSLEERRLMLDLVFCYNCLHGFTNVLPSEIGLELSSLSTRGHNYKLSVPHADVTSRKNFFSNRIAKSWNSLPFGLVNSTNTLSFKRGLKATDLSKFLIQSFS